MFGNDIAIDFGTATIRICDGRRIVINEPSVAAVDRGSGRIIAAGFEAKKMIGRAPSNINIVRPLRKGVISDFDVAADMIKLFIGKISKFSSFVRPRVALSVPSLVTEVERKAVVDAASISGARKVFLIEEPMAAALGAGIDISRPDGHMIVDIGGETTDIAILSLDGVVVSTTVKVGGLSFDEAIDRHIKHKYGIAVGALSAENIKMMVGTLYPDKDKFYEVKGRGKSGLPDKAIVGADEIALAMMEPAQLIATAICDVFEKVPPELAGDITRNGIVLTGGGSMLNGIDRLITAWSGVPVFVADEPDLCVVKGTAKAFSCPKYFKNTAWTALAY